jgi:hypothetical protein
MNEITGKQNQPSTAGQAPPAAQTSVARLRAALREFAPGHWPPELVAHLLDALDSESGIMTMADAGAVHAIFGAAERNAVVGYLPPGSVRVRYGEARHIGGLNVMDRDWAAEARADIRDLYLDVRLPGSRFSLPWKISDLILAYRAGTFMVDFDVAAFEAGGGQAAIPETMARAAAPELIRAARGWIAGYPRANLGPDDVADLTDAQVITGVQRHYEGGWAAFVAAEDPARPAETP